MKAKCDKERDVHAFSIIESTCQCGEYSKLSSLIDKAVLEELSKRPFSMASGTFLRKYKSPKISSWPLEPGLGKTGRSKGDV